MLEPVQRPQFSNSKAIEITQDLVNVFRKRKTTRFFQNAQVDRQIILNAIAVAATAPSGANKQPWSFSVIEDPITKKTIRDVAEIEEKKFYEKTAPQKWLDDLKPLHTDAEKPFITEASFLIPVFSKQYNLDSETGKTNNYYVRESVGLATGMLIAALHMAGLSVLTYTPTNRNFLVELLQRPRNERTFMVLVVGVAADDVRAPILSKKAMREVVDIFKGVEARIPKGEVGDNNNN